MKTHAIRIHKNGGPSVMKWEEVELPDPGPGEILIRNTAVGFNFVDTYHRSGLYKLPSLPSGLGIEAKRCPRHSRSAVGCRHGYCTRSDTTPRIVPEPSKLCPSQT